MPLRDDDAALLAEMEPFTFGEGAVRKAWSIGSGPLVVLVHGWGGIGAQMAPLAVALAEAGLQCVLFDALGHGQSADGSIGFDGFGNDTAALCQHLGEKPHALVGHSAGGLGMIAARYRHGLRAQHYVCIAVPLFPYVPLETLMGRLSLQAEQVAPLKPLLARQFDRDWDALAAGSVFAANPAGRLTLIYDRADERVRHGDADQIAKLWPDAAITKTDGLGHNRILKDPTVLAAITARLQQ
ncbi:MAG: alpha/beta hydrolase [Rhodospirillales bacterium]|nr:alpha/beta hydrolase [Rhodospirillales bacterium]